MGSFQIHRWSSGDELQTDCQRIESEISRLGDSQIAAIVTTTSCFAPRAMDNVEQVARICHRAGIPHMVNNAYGVQSHAICKEIANAWRRGRVDCVVQSTDKNFLVPVGGSIVASGARAHLWGRFAPCLKNGFKLCLNSLLQVQVPMFLPNWLPSIPDGRP